MTAIELIAFADESGTHDGSPYTVMAGWVGYAQEWKDFEREWQLLLAETGVPYIHAKELRQGTNIFKDKAVWPLPRRLALAKRATELAQDHALYSLSVLLKNSDYDTHYLEGDRSIRKHRAAIDSKYGICFRVFLSLLARITEKFEVLNSQLQIVLEDGHKNKRNAPEILRVMYEVAPALAGFINPAVTYAQKKQSPGVQAADLLAYPVFVLERDNKADYTNFESGFPERLSGEFLQNFRVLVSVETLRDIKTGQIAMARFRRELGPNWQQLDGFPVGWTARSTASFEGFVLVPPISAEVQQTLETAYCVLPRSA